MFLPLISTTFYLISCFVLNKYKTTFKDLYDNNLIYNKFIKSFSIIHNLALCLFSFYTFYNLYQQSDTNYLLIDINTYKKLVIENDKIINLCWLFTYSKIWEFFDTWILLLMGKETIFLQKFHHWGAVWTWYYICLTKSPMALLVSYYNAIIHTIMYFYYMSAIICSGYRLKIPNFIKQTITSLQLLQFTYGISTGTYYYLFEHFTEHKTHPAFISTVIFNIYAIILLGLFINFYYVNYIRSKPNHISKLN
jgi:hypothetical protein